MEKEERIYRHWETSEKSLERKLVATAKREGFMAVKMNDVMNGGLPDRLIVLPDGRVAWAEMKSRGCKPTPLQASRIRELRRLGHTVFVIDSPEQIEEFKNLLRLSRQ